MQTLELEKMQLNEITSGDQKEIDGGKREVIDHGTWKEIVKTDKDGKITSIKIVIKD